MAANPADAAESASAPVVPLESARETTLRLYLFDRAEPVDEHLRGDEARDRFERTQDATLWPNVFGAELVGDDDDVLDRW